MEAAFIRNFWHRTDFTVPAEFNGDHTWLNLDAINRDADIFANGKQVGAMHGFLQRGGFDITDLVHTCSPNSLAVLDYVPLLLQPDPKFGYGVATSEPNRKISRSGIP